MSGSVTILGTRHNSEESLQLVRETIPNRESDIVALELPPRFFDADSPNWSVKAALDPRREETLVGLLTQSVMFDEDYWKIDEMPLAAQVATREDIPVALIDQSFLLSMDQSGRAISADVLRNLKIIKREWNAHQQLLADREWVSLIERDLWHGGTAATPFLQYFVELRKQGASNPLNFEQRTNAKKQFDEKQVTKQLDVARQFTPNLMESTIDGRDEQMAGHLRWLANKGYDVLAFVALGHVEGIRQYLEDERSLREQYVRKPTIATTSEISTATD